MYSGKRVPGAVSSFRSGTRASARPALDTWAATPAIRAPRPGPATVERGPDQAGARLAPSRRAAAAAARWAAVPRAAGAESHIRGAGARYPPRPGTSADSAPPAACFSSVPCVRTVSASRASRGSRAAAALCTTSTSLNPPASAEVADTTRSTPGSTLR